MARSRRESHHSDGITNQKSPQLTSATKSAKSGLALQQYAARIFVNRFVQLIRRRNTS
jgi:hypothetical protein